MEIKVLILSLLLSFVCAHGAGLSAKVAGGTQLTKDNEADYKDVVMIHASKTVQCTGFLVADNVVITAASCLDSLNKDFSTVYVMNGGGGVVTVHENYTKETKENDIAVIVLNNAMAYKEGIPLATEKLAADAECIVAGYGVTSPDGKNDMTISLVSVKQAACEEEVAEQLCAGVTDGTNTHGVLCKGDIGSPLICGNTLVAIANSEGSCGTGASDHYQEVKTYKDWIQSHIPSSATSTLLSPVVILTTLAIILKTGS